MLGSMFSGRFPLKREEDGTIFIDRNGKLFAHILEWLRTGFVPKLDDYEPFINEANYFGLQALIEQLEDIDPFESTLLTSEYVKVLSSWIPSFEKKWGLIYQATKDGFDENQFHQKCNNKGPTVSVICSTEGYLFGGYISVSWTGPINSYTYDSNAFLFLLKNAHGSLPTKFEVSTPSTAVYNEYGPTFGSGHDIYLNSYANQNNTNYIGFPSSYIDKLGLGKNTFTGSSIFTATEIEVFAMI